MHVYTYMNTATVTISAVGYMWCPAPPWHATQLQQQMESACINADGSAILGGLVPLILSFQALQTKAAFQNCQSCGGCCVKM